MGSMAEWMRALAHGLFFGAWMFIWFWWLNHWKSGSKRLVLVQAIAAGVLSGINYGLLTTFHGRLLHWPMEILTILVVILHLFTAIILRRLVPRNEGPDQTRIPKAKESSRWRGERNVRVPQRPRHLGCNLRRPRRIPMNAKRLRINGSLAPIARNYHSSLNNA